MSIKKNLKGLPVASTNAFDAVDIAAPRAERRPVRSSHHGHERTDEYAWLRADNWQAVMRSPDLLAT